MKTIFKSILLLCLSTISVPLYSAAASTILPMTIWTEISRLHHVGPLHHDTTTGTRQRLTPDAQPATLNLLLRAFNQLNLDETMEPMIYVDCRPGARDVTFSGSLEKGNVEITFSYAFINNRPDLYIVLKFLTVIGHLKFGHCIPFTDISIEQMLATAYHYIGRQGAILGGALVAAISSLIMSALIGLGLSADRLMELIGRPIMGFAIEEEAAVHAGLFSELGRIRPAVELGQTSYLIRQINAIESRLQLGRILAIFQEFRAACYRGICSPVFAYVTISLAVIIFFICCVYQNTEAVCERYAFTHCEDADGSRATVKAFLQEKIRMLNREHGSGGLDWAWSFLGANFQPEAMRLRRIHGEIVLQEAALETAGAAPLGAPSAAFRIAPTATMPTLIPETMTAAAAPASTAFAPTPEQQRVHGAGAPDVETGDAPA